MRTPAEGCWHWYLPGGSSLPPRLVVGEDVLLVEAEKYHDLLFLWVYTLVRCQEGKTQKSANVRALPRGGSIPQRRPFS